MEFTLFASVWGNNRLCKHTRKQIIFEGVFGLNWGHYLIKYFRDSKLIRLNISSYPNVLSCYAKGHNTAARHSPGPSWTPSPPCVSGGGREKGQRVAKRGKDHQGGESVCLCVFVCVLWWIRVEGEGRGRKSFVSEWELVGKTLHQNRFRGNSKGKV